MGANALKVRTSTLWLLGFVCVAAVESLSSFNAHRLALPAPHDTYYVISSEGRFITAGWFLLFACVYFAFDRLPRLAYSHLLGAIHFWATFVGVNLTFLPMLVLQLAGQPARGSDPVASFALWSTVSSVGVLLTLAGTVVFVLLLGEVFWRRFHGPAWSGQ
jgi:cytochrome c oxidase subunit 1